MLTGWGGRSWSLFLFPSFFSISSLITDLDIGTAGTQRICEGKEHDSFFTASLFQDRFVDLEQTGLFWPLIAVVGLTAIQTSLGMAISASNRLGLAASSTLINNIARIIVQVIAVFLGYQIYGLVGGLVVGILLELIIQLKFIDYHIKIFAL
jgi:hypothetical protein